jgi:hypothetical protein
MLLGGLFQRLFKGIDLFAVLELSPANADQKNQ